VKIGLPVQKLVDRFLLDIRPLREIAGRGDPEPEGDFKIAPYFRRLPDGFTNFGTFTVWLIKVVISPAAA